MARERARRFGSADELRAELRRAAVVLASQSTRPVTAGRGTFSRRIPPRAIAITAVALVGVALACGLWWWRRSQPPPVPTIPVLAVLPFANHSKQPGDAAIAAAMRDVLIADLGGHPGLNVLSKAAVGEAPLDRTDLKKLSRDLGATHVVDGSLQRSGNALRVTVSLVRGDSGYVVWSDSYSAPEQEVFSLQERVAAGVGSAQPIGTSGVQAPRDVGASRDLEALTQYGQAVGFIERPDITGNLERAAQLLRAAVKRDPGFALAWARLGEAYWATYQQTLDPKWASEAATATHEAQRIDSRQPGVWISLAMIHHGTGRHEEAIGELRQALKLQPHSDDAHRLLGQVYRDTGRPEEAVGHLRKAIELRPNYWRNYNMLGGLYYATGNTKDAIEAFTRVTELQPDNARGFHNLGTVYYTMDDHVNALKYYERAIAIGPMADTYSNMGTIHYDEGRYEAAAEVFKEAVRLAPNDGLLYGNLGDAYTRLNDAAAARRAYEEAVRLDIQALKVNPNDAIAVARVALREAKLGRRQDADRDVARALMLNPNSAEVLYHCAVVRALNGNADAALDLLAQAVAKGYSVALASRDHDLASIRALPRFQDIINRR
jgi:eukaryotic-like serine/threonine-protein kinase